MPMYMSQLASAKSRSVLSTWKAFSPRSILVAKEASSALHVLFAFGAALYARSYTRPASMSRHIEAARLRLACLAGSSLKTAPSTACFARSSTFRAWHTFSHAAASSTCAWKSYAAQISSSSSVSGSLTNLKFWALPFFSPSHCLPSTATCSCEAELHDSSALPCASIRSPWSLSAREESGPSCFVTKLVSLRPSSSASGSGGRVP
mmetsp:Transcript_45842/g.120217  ORF Transcript_45842/g.120217 Transcript_45842/m.120217 type:complete len:206 (+) Transcript_45842:269-886(+)